MNKTYSQLGEIKYGREIGKKVTSHAFIWHACEGCGKQRWVMLVKGLPRNTICLSCACRINMTGRKGNRANGWNGGQYRSIEDYILILKPEHPKAWRSGYIKRARLVLEEKLGRYLLNGCEPHHINGVRDDDRPENLMELYHNEHMKLNKGGRAYAQAS